MKVIAIIQARMSSTRLPGKVLMKIAGKPMLWYLIMRLKKSSLIKTVVVATSTQKEDDVIVKFCRQERLQVFRGNLANVLDRYYQTALKFSADIVIRLTSDCPLIDHTLIEKGLDLFTKHNSDYVSNTVRRTFPRGFDFEIISFKALKEAQKRAKELAELEHVTPYIWRYHPDDFNIRQLIQQRNNSAYRLTVDTPEDFQLVKILIEKYHAHTRSFSEIIRILDHHPDLTIINKHVEQKKYGL